MYSHFRPMKCSVMQHELNMKEGYKGVKQKLRHQGPVREDSCSSSGG